MRINKSQQYGLLLACYLDRAGKAKLNEIARVCNLHLPFLEQVARKMKLKGIVSATRGPDGGYTLAQSVTVLQVFAAMGPVRLLHKEELDAYKKNYTTEERVLIEFLGTIGGALLPHLRRTIRSVTLDLMESDAELFEGLNERAVN